MSRLKEVTATATAVTFIIPEGFSTPKLVDASATAAGAVAAQTRLAVNNTIVPELSQDWTGHVVSFFCQPLPAEAIRTLRLALETYVRDQIAVQNAIRWSDYETQLNCFAD